MADIDRGAKTSAFGVCCGWGDSSSYGLARARSRPTLAVKDLAALGRYAVAFGHP